MGVVVGMGKDCLRTWHARTSLLLNLPTQAITFMAYEAISKRVGDWPIFQPNVIPAAPVRAAV